MSLLNNPKCGTWVSFIRDFFAANAALENKLNALYDQGLVVPAKEDLFRAFELSPIGNIKIVILGQDPYPTKGDADGLAFSTRAEKLPPTLRNILMELDSDLGVVKLNGDLSGWASQGVFLLNTALTNLEGEIGAHKNIGWAPFVDHFIDQISFRVPHVVFMLWGKDAQKREHLIDKHRHLVLKATHPSPLSARKGFFGSKPFSKANEFLRLKRNASIDWSK